MLLKNWHRESHLGIGLAYKLKDPALAPKYPCALFIRKNDSLVELGHQWFLAFLVEDQVCYIFVIVREAVFGEDYVLEFCGGTYSEVW